MKSRPGQGNVDPSTDIHCPGIGGDCAQDLIHRDQPRTEVAPPGIENESLRQRRLCELKDPGVAIRLVKKIQLATRNPQLVKHEVSGEAKVPIKENPTCNFEIPAMIELAFISA